MNAQERLRAAARSAGWSAEYEVRGFEWIADVLCVSGNRFVALEDQRVDNGTLVDRTERYRRSGVAVAWFTPNLHRRTISRLVGVVPVFDAAEIDTVVPQVLATAISLPCKIDTCSRCELCGYPVSTIASMWCWSCWFRFTLPPGKLVRPYVHLTDWNRRQEEREAHFAELAAAKKDAGLGMAGQFRGTR